jgi:multidrug resistance efflux pump
MNSTTQITPYRLGRRVTAHLVSAIIYIAAALALIYVTRQYYVYPRTDDAYVRANTIGMAPHVSGPIVDLPIVDNQRVRAVNYCS